MAPKKIKVLVCDDNQAVRVTLTRSLKYKPDIEVVGEIASFDDLVTALAGKKPDVILMDVNMPGTSGLDGLKSLKEKGSRVPVIIMSADKRNEEHALKAGAASFFYKGSTDLSQLLEDIRKAAR